MSHCRDNVSIVAGDKLKVQIPSQGWKQLLTGRKEVLDAYDRARDQARSHEVETYHGKVVEAAFRKWLKNFLPARYGVTSGYIVSPGLSSKDKTPHFDVIIYDAMESPVLWVEEDPDTSAQGRSLAIPVEYVRCVLEIKASFSNRNVKAAIGHLSDLLPLMKGLDDPSDPYKLHLPSSFSCGCIFAELRVADASSDSALNEMLEGLSLRGFLGGLVLRGEGHTQPQTGRVALVQSEQPSVNLFDAKVTPLLEVGISNTIRIADKVNVGAMITWSESTFSEFAFDLVAMLKGNYRPGRLSSFYGLGSSWLELMTDVGAKRID